MRDDLHVVGIDFAAGMLEVARAKAVREGLSRVRFEVMAAEAMTFADGSMDVVLSRFGLPMFGDRAASARQMAHVLTSCPINHRRRSPDSRNSTCRPSRGPADYPATRPIIARRAGTRSRHRSLTVCSEFRCPQVAPNLGQRREIQACSPPIR